MKFTIRAFAVICVAVTSAYIMVLGWRLDNTLSGPGWCATAIGAGKATSGNVPVKGLEVCVALLTIQLNSISLNSHILLGTIALCLAVLIIIVVAGARFTGETKFGRVDIEPARVQIDQPPEKPVPVVPQENKDDSGPSVSQ